MPSITFNAFSFLQKQLKEKGMAYKNATLETPLNSTPYDLIDQMGLSKNEIEAVFINGKVLPFDTIIKDGDRVAFVPHGTPGPYRVFLGFKKPRNGPS